MDTETLQEHGSPHASARGMVGSQKAYGFSTSSTSILLIAVPRDIPGWRLSRSAKSKTAEAALNDSLIN